MTETTIYLQIESRTAAQEAEARRIILELAAASGEPAWTVLQSFPKILFVRWPSEIPDFGQIFNGRIFGGQAEVRWIREGSEWRIWSIREAETGSEPYRRQSRRYYLWGVAKDGKFSEDRIPGVPDYPVLQRPKDEDRAFIEVMEYARLWTDVTTPEDLEELEKHLNQPRVAAHRFYNLSCGRDPEPKKDKDE